MWNTFRFRVHNFWRRIYWDLSPVVEVIDGMPKIVVEVANWSFRYGFTWTFVIFSERTNMFISPRSAKVSVTAVLTLLLCSACVFETGGSRTALNSKDYQCRELQDLADEQGQVFLRGFLGASSLVHASEKSCASFVERPVVSAWRTKDVFSCVVGFRCAQTDTLDNED